MATSTLEQLFHPQLLNYTRAYLFQLQRTGDFVTPADDLTQRLAQSAALAIADLGRDRDARRILMREFAKFIDAADPKGAPSESVLKVLERISPVPTVVPTEPAAPVPTAPVEAPPAVAPPPVVVEVPTAAPASEPVTTSPAAVDVSAGQPAVGSAAAAAKVAADEKSALAGQGKKRRRDGSSQAPSAPSEQRETPAAVSTSSPVAAATAPSEEVTPVAAATDSPVTTSEDAPAGGSPASSDVA